MSDCLWGLLDGINEDGLAVSLTFGGRRDVGNGFAISLVVRYLLETCETVGQAREALERIPVHAPQNLTLLDRSGAHLTAYVGPGRAAEFRSVAATTNHQGRVEWPEYARAIRTVERERCVLALLDDPQMTRERFVDAFLEPPHPAEGRAEYRWPVVRRSIEIVGAGPVFLTVDIDVLDPAFIPGGTGTPEPGGMTTTELLWAARTLAAGLDLVGADLVEVIPTGVGPADTAALAGDRIVREILTGIALRRCDGA